MSPLKIYILEDEIVTQEVLKQTLENLGYNVCGMESNAEKALEEILYIEPHIAILDINVDGDKTGIWLGNQLEIPFIYLTAYSDANNVKNAVKTNPVNYLRKPFQEKDLFIALEMAVNKVDNKKEIIVRDKNLKFKIDINSIKFAKKDDHYLILHQENSKKAIRATVNEFLEMVNEDFFQVHRSYIINKNYVSSVSKKAIIIDDYNVPISSSYRENVIEKLL